MNKSCLFPSLCLLACLLLPVQSFAAGRTVTVSSHRDETVLVYDCLNVRLFRLPFHQDDLVLKERGVDLVLALRHDRGRLIVLESFFPAFADGKYPDFEFVTGMATGKEFLNYLDATQDRFDPEAVARRQEKLAKIHGGWNVYEPHLYDDLYCSTTTCRGMETDYPLDRIYTGPESINSCTLAVRYFETGSAVGYLLVDVPPQLEEDKKVTVRCVLDGSKAWEERMVALSVGKGQTYLGVRPLALLEKLKGGRELQISYQAESGDHVSFSLLVDGSEQASKHALSYFDIMNPWHFPAWILHELGGQDGFLLLTRSSEQTWQQKSDDTRMAFWYSTSEDNQDGTLSLLTGFALQAVNGHGEIWISFDDGPEFCEYWRHSPARDIPAYQGQLKNMEPSSLLLDMRKADRMHVRVVREDGTEISDHFDLRDFAFAQKRMAKLRAQNRENAR